MLTLPVKETEIDDEGVVVVLLAYNCPLCPPELSSSYLECVEDGETCVHFRGSGGFVTCSCPIPSQSDQKGT